MDISEGLDVDSSLGEVLVLVEWVVEGVEVLVWWSVILLESGVSTSLLEVCVHLVSEVSLGEETVAWHPVVSWGSLVVPGVLEAGGVGVGEVEWHVGVSIVDSVKLSSFHKLVQVVLDDWVLSVGGVLGSSGVSSDSISESEDVLESRVLQGIWVHVNKSFTVHNV